MTKQEIIQEAYGEHWETVKHYVDENGWIDFGIFGYDKYTNTSIASLWDMHRLCGGFENMQSKCLKKYPWITYHRPKSLEGIDTNNGWIKIEKHGNNLKDDKYYFVYIDGYILIKQYNLLQHNYWIKYVTHYQPIIEPLPPIY